MPISSRLGFSVSGCGRMVGDEHPLAQAAPLVESPSVYLLRRYGTRHGLGRGRQWLQSCVVAGSTADRGGQVPGEVDALLNDAEIDSGNLTSLLRILADRK